MYAGRKNYDPKSACREIQDRKSERGEIITATSNHTFLEEFTTFLGHGQMIIQVLETQ